MRNRDAAPDHRIDHLDEEGGGLSLTQGQARLQKLFMGAVSYLRFIPILNDKYMTVTLRAISIAEIQEIAESGLLAGEKFAAGALPPPFVAQRSLTQIAAGKSIEWCGNYFIVRNDDHMIVGGCGFKDTPLNGRVEIGYGVAPECQGQGIATVAVRALLAAAFASVQVDEVLAQINPANIASIRVAEKLNFVRGDTQLEEDNEVLDQWLVKKSHGFCLEVAA